MSGLPYPVAPHGPSLPGAEVQSTPQSITNPADPLPKAPPPPAGPLPDQWLFATQDPAFRPDSLRMIM